jgi:hypothetical protein
VETALPRFTGKYPPLETLKRFPNWEYALDEEGIPGQDETTIRPAQVQDHLADDVAFTAGTVTLATGTQLDALLEVACGAISGVTVHYGIDWMWSLRKLGKPARWQPIDFAWLPMTQRPPPISLEDAHIFPLDVVATLPVEPGGAPQRIRIPRK